MLSCNMQYLIIYLYKVFVIADGAMDSPGFSAKYCVYTVMEIQTRDILAIEIVDKRETGLKSTNMEMLAFKRVISKLNFHQFWFLTTSVIKFCKNFKQPYHIDHYTSYKNKITLNSYLDIIE